MPSPPISCDACLLPQSPDHLARRIRRLELATRFRPIHISVLFLTPAPPASLDHFFYSDASPTAFSLELLAAALPEISPAPALADFQRAGFFLTHAVECPLEEFPAGEGNQPLSPAALAARFAPTLVRRITLNFKPRFILPLGAALSAFLPTLHSAALAPQLLLTDASSPLPLPDPASPETFRAALASLLTRARSAARPA